MKGAGGGYGLFSASYFQPCVSNFFFLCTGVTAEHTKRERSQADPEDLLSPLQEMKRTFHSILAEVELTEAILTKVS